MAFRRAGGLYVTAMVIDLDHDRALAAAAQQDPEAFQELFTSYFDPIFRYCALQTGNPREAEELALEVFAEALAALPGYRCGNQPLLAWLLAIAKSRAPSRPGEVRRIDTPCETALLKEACLEVRRLLGRVDAMSAAVLVLRFVVECSFEQIAVLLGIAPATAKMCVYRAVARVQRTLGPTDEG